jgi:predicted CoA-substrate-specific enzyme activase
MRLLSLRSLCLCVSVPLWLILENLMRFAAGVDVGSTQTKAVVMEEGAGIVARALVDTGANVIKAAENSFHVACREAKIDPRDVGYVVGTGYGRYKITFGNAQMTEISCHARGANFVFPNTRTVIDMGGQDAKAISIGADGQVLDFVMNDKCAAGTGRFLANAADVMGIGLDEVGPLSLEGTRPVKLTTVCTVFVESDILSYLSMNKKPSDILRGVHLAIAKRTISLARRVEIQPDITMTGGVARNLGMVQALEEVLEAKLQVSPDAHYMGAIGAALFALEKEDDDFESAVWRTTTCAT